MSMDRRPTTQDISWFLDLNRNRQVEMNPPYQRRSVWSPRDRRYFLDTIFRGYPSPAIFLHKRIEDGGRAQAHVYEVVDGKQRLETILDFVGDKITLAADFGDTSLNGKRWSELGDSHRRQFWDYVIPVEFIKLVEGTIINEVFQRLNRNSRKLERQELRHAQNEGWFISYVEREPETDDFWSTYKITTTARARRMHDIQFISELMMVVIKGAVTGFDQDALDDLCSEYETPEETVPDFDKEQAGRRFSQVKQYLRDMDQHNGCISRHAATSTNFYSLWAWAALSDPLPPAGVAAQKFEQLIQAVDELQAQDDIEAFLKTQKAKSPLTGEAYRYWKNAAGASTEPAQRQARHEVLRLVLNS